MGCIFCLAMAYRKACQDHHSCSELCKAVPSSSYDALQRQLSTSCPLASLPPARPLGQRPVCHGAVLVQGGRAASVPRSAAPPAAALRAGRAAPATALVSCLNCKE